MYGTADVLSVKDYRSSQRKEKIKKSIKSLLVTTLVAAVLVGIGLIIGQYVSGFHLLSHPQFLATKITTALAITLTLAIGGERLYYKLKKNPKE
ncbi:MAG: hypothetical protein K940chlam9_00452 [Chlamydiae bacterium]|nr:hypothetical protein [Chlamydiota bacterium]